ncbi:peptide-methionine (S)-S-oxide reductase MsrA [Alkalilimnicola sp. S0819]|uniref:peptide-methionine (S)-S-oxide reductase MsrA n=1 Tax=Alkalilimnicola sp. S0819 TaxID=2613922 RepID=UPI0012618F6C|nr:peptide-methionine (S)-S-oxide reductase MsrA [Alkalilimnicola sp. S0819]KAB7619566.1 peptide-methionine (S)-S-oxide reductase MsrA [Alkalilimnicola sp. S0819]MPQ17617.1 peptide-methionine (S)-S-oxide reductase MsrA [Alkalilimnicola sp. S0819]
MRGLLVLLCLLLSQGVAHGAEPRSALFAGGCFWCMEPPFDELDGVLSTTSGYAGGDVANPSYEQVTAGGTGHREVVRVLFDPDKVSYQRLLEVYWRNVDPLDAGGQFCDRGESYTSALFVADEAQREAAQRSKRAAAAQLGENIVTPILPATDFYPAEEYHQNYYRKNPARYHFYKWNCGRAQRLEQVWGGGG